MSYCSIHLDILTWLTLRMQRLRIITSDHNTLAQKRFSEAKRMQNCISNHLMQRLKNLNMFIVIFHIIVEKFERLFQKTDVVNYYSFNGKTQSFDRQREQHPYLSFTTDDLNQSDTHEITPDDSTQNSTQLSHQIHSSF